MNRLPRLDAAALRRAGRTPALPARLAVPGAPDLEVDRLLRVLPGRRLVLRGRDHSGRALLVKAFVGPRARRDLHRELHGHRLLLATAAAVPPLCLQAPLAGGGALLGQTWLEAAQPAGAAVLAAGPGPQGQAALAPVLEQLCLLHTGGVRQADLHLDNFLRAGDRLWCIDAADMRPLSGGDADLVAGLVGLHAQLPVAWDADLPATLARAADLLGRALPAPAPAALVAARRKVLADITAKALRDCSLFRSGRYAGAWWARARDDQVPALADWLAAPDAPLAHAPRLKAGNSATVVRWQLGEQPVVVKRYNLKSPWHRVKRALRQGRAERAWAMGHALRRAGVATPRPRGVVVERHGPLRGRGWLLVDAVEGPDLGTLWAQRAPRAGELRALGALLGGLLASGASHGDLKASNLLWGPDGPVFIDLDAAALHRQPVQCRRAQARDLTRFGRNWPPGHPAHAPVHRLLADLRSAAGMQDAGSQ